MRIDLILKFKQSKVIKYLQDKTLVEVNVKGEEQILTTTHHGCKDGSQTVKDQPEIKPISFRYV